MARGTLRIFLGAAPGVGKTYEMLEEAHRLGGRGDDVAVALATDHGRAGTRALLQGLEVIPPRRARYGGSTHEEMDLDAVLTRAPGTAVVDEYAHSNVPGGRNPKRWQDVDELLSAGINVLSTVNIQDLASLGDVVSAVTGVRPAETVPDDVVRRADQIDLVDIPPDLLRQRLSEGKIYAADRIDAALSSYFRLGNLSALRELTLLWLADRVDEGLAKYRAENGILDSWPARERIVVGLTGGPEGEALIRRGARILTRVSGGDLLAVHVRAAKRVASESPQALEQQRRLAQDLGGSYHIVAGEDPAAALLDFARSVNATQIVVGISRHKNLAGLPGRVLGGGVGTRVVRGSGDIDVHMVSHPLGAQGTGWPRPGDLGRARIAVGLLLAVLLPALLQLLLVFVNPDHSVATAMLVQLSGSVAVALVGGLWPAVLAALWSSLLVNYFSTPPTGNLIISDPQNFLALFVFLGVSSAVAMVVDLSARRSKEAAGARAEATTLSDLTRGAAGSEDTVQSLLEQARTVFQVRGTALLSRGNKGDGAWRLLASAGEVPDPAPRPAPDGHDPEGHDRATGESADRENIEEIDSSTRLVLYGRILPASDRRLLAAFGMHLAAQLERQQLVASRREMMRLAESNTMRTSILRAVSHDLRTPLAGIKLAVGGLRQTGVPYTPQEEQELLATIEECSDRLDVLVGNLLDMSRLTSDSVRPHLHPLRWYEVIPGALHGIPPDRVRVELPANMPEVDADQGMLERVVANIVENAVKYAPDSDIVVAGAAGGLSPAALAGRPAGELRIIDHGRGIPAERVLDMFRPFQRLDDSAQAAGVGLGLAVAKGFTEAMAGRLSAEPTPGGGLTMVITLPLSTGEPFDASPGGAPFAPQSALAGRRTLPAPAPSAAPSASSVSPQDTV